MMESLELFHISAKLSQKLTEWSPLYNKITKVIDQNTFELSRSETPVDPKHFWCDDLRDRMLTAERKARIHIQYHRSKDIYGNVLAFARALKELLDSGIPLYHEGVPVVDLWVLSTAEFDVSDVFDKTVLWLTDPMSGYTLPSVSTHENMDTLRDLGPDVCRNIGIIPPNADGVGEQLKQHRLEAYQGTMPYLWVAAIVEDERIGGGKARRMVHVDICAAAYDGDAIHAYDRSFVSLKIFTTPEYNLVMTTNLERAIRSKIFSQPKLIIEPCALSTDGRWQQPMLNFMPFSVRHLRCFDKMNNSYIEMTPVDYFVENYNDLLPGELDEWLNIVAALRHDIMSNVPAGAKVLICNLEKRPELNGKSGRVHNPKSSEASSTTKGRIPVWVPNIDHPVCLTPRCVRITTGSQYSSLGDYVRRAEAMCMSFSEEQDAMRAMSKKEEKKFQKARAEDLNLQLSFDILTTGKLSILCYADRKFVEGIRKMLSPPFNRILSTPYAKKLRNGLEVADHPQWKEALKILKLIRIGKQRVLEQKPSLMRSDGSMLRDEGSDFHQLMERIVKKIQANDGLKNLFALMDRHKLFPNPVKDLK